MNVNFFFGLRYCVLGFFISNLDNSVHIFPMPFVAIRVRFGPASIFPKAINPRPAPVKHSQCGICGCPPESHTARENGFSRGDDRTLVADVTWSCKCGKCDKFYPVVTS